jgi:hypothetical protein
VAEGLDWSPSKIVRVEAGTVAVGVTDLQALLVLYGVHEASRIDELVAMARGSKRQPFSAYKDLFAPETLRYFAYESSAHVIRQFEPLVIPALLQTEEYAKALLGGLEVGQGRIDQIWESRAERQDLLDRPDAPEMFFILDEAVIRRSVGGDAVMRALRAHLLELNSRQTLTIQVLPFMGGAHEGLNGPFVFLEFANPHDPDVLYVEGSVGDTILRDDEEVSGRYLEAFFRLERQALALNELEAHH